MQSPRHVQFVSLMAGVPWGGSEELWHAAAERLLDAGVEVTVVSKKWDVIPDKIEALVARGARLRRYDQGFWNRVRSGLLRRGVRAFGPFKLLAEADATVVSLGTFADARWFPLLMDELLGNRHTYVTVFHNSPHEPEPIPESDRQFLRRFFSSSEMNFYVAEKNRRIGEEMMGCGLEKAALINNPMNIGGREAKPFPESEKLRLVCVGRIDFSAKAQDMLVRAMARNWKDRDFELFFFGEGEDVSRLDELIVANGLSGKLRIAGFTSDVDGIYRDAHALVLPSRFEGMPIVCVEAALSGRPAMITDAGDSKRCFREGVSGFVADECSEDAVADALERLWEARGRLREMGVAAHEDAKREFSEDGVAKMLASIGVNI